MKIVTLVIGLMTLSISSLVSAQNWINGETLIDVRWYAADIGYITTQSGANPEACNGNTSSPSIYFSTEIPGHEKILSIALSALVAGKKVNILVNGCNGEHQKLQGIVIKSN